MADIPFDDEMYQEFGIEPPVTAAKIVQALYVLKRKSEIEQQRADRAERSVQYERLKIQLARLFSTNASVTSILQSYSIGRPLGDSFAAELDGGADVQRLWGLWLDRVAALVPPTVPPPDSDEAVVSSFLLELFKVLEDGMPSSCWRAIRGQGILTRPSAEPEYPDAIWYLRNELFPSAAGQIIPCKFKHFKDGLSSEINARDARSEAAIYGARALLQQPVAEEDSIAERHVTVIASHGEAINFLQLVLESDQENIEVRETGFLPLLTLGNSLPPEPTPGFTMLVRMLHTDPDMLSTTTRPRIAITLGGREVRLDQRLGIGGTCDVYVCAANDIVPALLHEAESTTAAAAEGLSSSTPADAVSLAGISSSPVVVKIVCHRDLIKVNILETEANVLRDLNAGGVSGAPSLLFNCVNMRPPFIVTSPVGIPLLQYTLLKCRQRVRGGGGEEKEASVASSISAAPPISSGAEAESNIDVAVRESCNMAKKALQAIEVALAASVAEGSDAELERLAVQVARDVIPVLCGAWKLGWVHMDLRPANMIAVPRTFPPDLTPDSIAERFQRLIDEDAPFRITVIDWAASKRINDSPREVVGVAIFQSDELLSKFKTSGCSSALSMLRAMTKSIDYYASPSEDMKALSHTITALIHGSDDMIPPWARAQCSSIPSARLKWYRDHVAAAPNCPCARFWLTVHPEGNVV